MEAAGVDGEFQFSLPPVKSGTDLQLRIGDDFEKIKINPQPRPELKALSATIELPEYLKRSEPVEAGTAGWWPGGRRWSPIQDSGGSDSGVGLCVGKQAGLTYKWRPVHRTCHVGQPGIDI